MNSSSTSSSVAATSPSKVKQIYSKDPVDLVTINEKVSLTKNQMKSYK
jgi:hypothetical protein